MTTRSAARPATRSPIRTLAQRYAYGELTRDEYLAERRKLLNAIERELNAPPRPATADMPTPRPAPQPAEDPARGNRVTLMLLGVLILALALLLFLR